MTGVAIFHPPCADNTCQASFFRFSISRTFHLQAFRPFGRGSPNQLVRFRKTPLQPPLSHPSGFLTKIATTPSLQQVHLFSKTTSRIRSSSPPSPPEPDVPGLKIFGHVPNGFCDEILILSIY